MAFPTAINSQITDAMTEANTKVLGDVPALASGELYQATSQALCNAAHHAVSHQQNTIVTAQAAVTQGVGTLLSADTAATGTATTAAAPRIRRRKAPLPAGALGTVVLPPGLGTYPPGL